MTIKELYPLWYEDRAASVKPSSLSAYDNRYHLFIEKDPISDKEIGTLRNSDVQKFCNGVFSGYSRSYAKAIMHLLKSIIDYYYISNDEPVRIYKVRYPTLNTYERKSTPTYSPLQKALLTHYCESRMDKTQNVAILIALYTGLRIGEVCGLKWGDIDFAKGRLTVRRTIERFTEDGRSAVHSMTPKTFSSARTIPINDDLRTLVFKCRKDDVIYIASGRDVPTEPSSLRRSFGRVCKRTGVPELKFHSLRHLFATELILSHVDPSTVGSLMGHHNASTTLNIYSHTNERAQFMAVNTGSGALLSRCPY